MNIEIATVICAALALSGCDNHQRNAHHQKETVIHKYRVAMPTAEQPDYYVYWWIINDANNRPLYYYQSPEPFRSANTMQFSRVQGSVPKLEEVEQRGQALGDDKVSTETLPEEIQQDPTAAQIDTMVNEGGPAGPEPESQVSSSSSDNGASSSDGGSSGGGDSGGGGGGDGGGGGGGD